MAQNKKNHLEVKVPLNSSVRRGVKLEFLRICDKHKFDKNILIESFVSEFLKGFKE